MREIKFRAWDKNAEIMVYSDQQYDDFFFEFKDGKLKAFRVVICPGTLHEPPYPSSEELDNLTEYTGLKDKNSKEIWEGDIARVGKKENYPVHFKIIWGKGRWQMADKADRRWELFNWNGNIEIRGNIYENPELLERRE